MRLKILNNCKKNKKKWIFLVGFISLIFFNQVFAALGQEYPVMGGVDLMTGGDVFVYCYNAAIASAALIGLVGLVMQGITIMTAGENAGKVSEAKKRIQSIFLGLGVMGSSYVMLTTINPELTKIKMPEFENIITNLIPDTPPINSGNNVPYTEVPIGAIIESILNATSTAKNQAYNYSSVKINTSKSTEEMCYMYNNFGNAIDKNGDGKISELDEYQGLDMSICINELLKAIEHKILYLNGGKYKCGTPGVGDEDSPFGAGNGSTTLDINYHDWDLNAKGENPGCSGPGECTADGTEGIINKLKKFIRTGCKCEDCERAPIGDKNTARNPSTDYYCKNMPGSAPYCDSWCSDHPTNPDGGCCGGPRGRDGRCQKDSINGDKGFNNVLYPENPYYKHDPCSSPTNNQRKNMDCMRQFINRVTFGKSGPLNDCNDQDSSSGKNSDSGQVQLSFNFDCSGFDENDDLELKEPLTVLLNRLISFKTYFTNRLTDLEVVERFMMRDSRLELYSRAEFQEMKQSAIEKNYGADQSEFNFKFFPSQIPYSYETAVYRKRFNCSLYEYSNDLAKKDIYEDNDNRANTFNCNWKSDEEKKLVYDQNQKENKLIRIRTGEMISDLHVDNSMDLQGGMDPQAMTNAQKDASICSRGELVDLSVVNGSEKMLPYYDFESNCNSVTSESIVKRDTLIKGSGDNNSTKDIFSKRLVEWNDAIYKDGAFSYIDDQNDSKKKYYTGEDISADGDPLTFYVVKQPGATIDKYYTGRDQMPQYFKTAFIDYSDFAENAAIETEVSQERGYILPSLTPVGQLSYHTKIYAKQMIRNLDRTIEQVNASIDALDNIANTFVEGGDPGYTGRDGQSSIGCDCKSCTGLGSSISNCDCTVWCDPGPGCCGMWECRVPNNSTEHPGGDGGCTTCNQATQTTCATCAKVSRYAKFMPEPIDNAEDSKVEIGVENIINDSLPISLKMIVKGRGCPKEANAFTTNAIYVGKMDAKEISGKGEKIAVNETDKRPIVINYSGGSVSIAGTRTEGMITADDAIEVVNNSNGKTKLFQSSVDQAIWVGYGDITEIMQAGTNNLSFYVVDKWEHYVSTTDIYVIFEEYKKENDMCGGGCSGPEYVPPVGYVVKECHAWDSGLKEERTCTKENYKGDIVVILEEGTLDCHCGAKGSPEYRGCTNGGRAVWPAIVNPNRCSSYKCVCPNGREKACHLGKPVIYLYPEKRTNVNVKVLLDGEFTVDIPKYDKEKGWNVVASPSGELLNINDGKKYDYLYWEADLNKDPNFDLSNGFVIEGNKTEEFLKAKLYEMGLIEKEVNDFIEYWAPRMKNNKYNLIHFSGKQYTDTVNMDIIPKPDSELRVFMVFQALENFRFIKPQEFEKFERTGFSAVEWGGSEVDYPIYK